MWGERPWRGGVGEESKLAKMACSGSLAPHFVNNDYVTAEIVIAVHMCIVRYSLGHGVCEVHICMSSCIMAVSIGLAWEERMQHECCCGCSVSQERGCVHLHCIMSVATAAVPARRKQICLQFLWLLVSSGLSACVNSKTISAVNRMKRNTALFLPFSVLGVHCPQLSDLQSASWNQPWQTTATLVQLISSLTFSNPRVFQNTSPNEKFTFDCYPVYTIQVSL